MKKYYSALALLMSLVAPSIFIYMLYGEIKPTMSEVISLAVLTGLFLMLHIVMRLKEMFRDANNIESAKLIFTCSYIIIIEGATNCLGMLAFLQKM